MDNLKPNFIQGTVLFFEYKYQSISIKVSNFPRSSNVMNMVITGSLGMYIFHIFKIT